MGVESQPGTVLVWDGPTAPGGGLPDRPPDRIYVAETPREIQTKHGRYVRDTGPLIAGGPRDMTPYRPALVPADIPGPAGRLARGHGRRIGRPAPRRRRTRSASRSSPGRSTDDDPSPPEVAETVAGLVLAGGDA